MYLCIEKNIKASGDMKNPIKRFLERRQEKKHQCELLQTLRTWGWLEKVFESGQLSFDYEHHRLFITQPMAVLLMANGADGWVNSIREIYRYAHWRQTQRAWEEFIQKEEMAAVRKAMAARNDVKLSRDDIDRIRTSRRMEITQDDMDLPKMESFEFFIIPNSTEAAVEPIAVGHFDPETEKMEIAQWSEVKALLKKEKDGE